MKNTRIPRTYLNLLLDFCSGLYKMRLESYSQVSFLIQLLLKAFTFPVSITIIANAVIPVTLSCSALCRYWAYELHPRMRLYMSLQCIFSSPLYRQNSRRQVFLCSSICWVYAQQWCPRWRSQHSGMACRR